jgi:hypothetical protein
MTTREGATFKQQLALASNAELFEIWSREYDARNAERVALVVAELNKRNLDPGVIQL